jgi:hypothetical protein
VVPDGPLTGHARQICDGKGQEQSAEHRNGEWVGKPIEARPFRGDRGAT